MMKNSKLSKLLVAGVSVAMLASALAPMAFAEETSNESVETDDNVTFYVQVRTVNGSTATEYNSASSLNPILIQDAGNKYSFTATVPVDKDCL